MKYLRILLAGAAVPVTALVLITAVATGYAFMLAFEVRGTPDQAKIAQFAQQIGRASWTAMQVLFTVPFAVWASGKFREHAPQYGAAVGILVAVIQFIAVRAFSLEIVLGVALSIGAGWLGGVLAASRADFVRGVNHQ
jgi:hypothetical protein